MAARTPSIEATALDRLTPAPWNPRTIKDARFENLCRSIERDPEFLWRRPVLAMADGTIYAGNMRYRAAQHLRHERIPAIVEDIPEQLARERALRDNAQWGEWLEDDLAALLQELRVEGTDLALLGFDERELQQLLDRAQAGTAGLTDPDEIPELPEESVSKRGDLWLLGEHRVFCGDATDKGDVARAVGEQKVQCMWTDPPYGVNYEGGTSDHLTIAGDQPENLAALLGGAFGAVDEVLAPGSAIYVCHPAGAGSVVFAQEFLARGWRLHQTLVWVKDKLVPGHSDYHYRHEPILFGYKPGARGRRGRGSGGWYGGNDADSVFEFASARRNDEHPTAKPVALVETMLRNSSQTGGTVLDPFLGSGSTLIACERLKRKCVGIEIDPRYVDVTVRRWERLTGGRAELWEGGA